MILNQSLGLRVGEWIEIVDLHHRLLVKDEIGMTVTIIVMRIAVNESESGIKIGIGIGILLLLVGDLLPSIGCLLQLRLRDRGKDLQCRIINRGRRLVKLCFKIEKTYWFTLVFSLDVSFSLEAA